jgi:hypothetical protein
MFFSENGPITTFPSLSKFGKEIVAVSSALLGGDENTCRTFPPAGPVAAAGGQDRNDFARRATGIREPEVVMPASAPPWRGQSLPGRAHECASGANRPTRSGSDGSHHAEHDPTGRLRAPILGVVDPIEELSSWRGRRLLLRGCLRGRIMLPFVRKLGYPSLPSTSACRASPDVRRPAKYGYAAKPASRSFTDPALRRHQMFVSTDWPGGIYPSPGAAGSRPGGPVAAAWALLHYLGEEGYLQIADVTMQAAKRMQAGVKAIPA